MNSSPYPGLRPFKRDEIDIFFGRDKISNQLIERLGNTHFIAVVGPSGCGKSSIVRTGLLAGLNIGFLPNAGTQWCVATLRPGNHPFVNLAKALLEDFTLTEKYTSHFTDKEKAVKHLTATLSRGSASLLEFLKDLSFPQNTNFLLIVDQFEELFRYRQQGNVDEFMAFVRLLLESSREHPNVYIIITMRSEFIGDCALFHDLLEAINQGLFVTPRLNRKQLRLAIEGPAKVHGGQIESNLTNLLLNKMDIFEEKSGREQLPVLQHALMRMWHLAKAENPNKIILTKEHYVEIGELTHALSQHADEIYNELDKLIVPLNPKKVAEIMFRRLCERDEARRDVRSPVNLSEVAKLAGIQSPQQIVNIVDVFRKKGRNFLTLSSGNKVEDRVIDIGHESLFYHWKQLNTWADYEAMDADIYRLLEITAIRHKNRNANLFGGDNLDSVRYLFERLIDPEKLPYNLNNFTSQSTGYERVTLWAKRYGKEQGKHFELAMVFLRESYIKWQQKEDDEKALEQKRRERQERDAARQRNFRLSLITIGVLSIFVVIVSILAKWAYTERDYAIEQEQVAISEKQKAEQAKIKSQLNNAAWLAKFDDYKAAKEVLGKISETHKEFPTSYRHTYKLLNWFTHLMGGDSEYVYKGSAATLYSVAINKKHLAVAGESGTVALFDVKTGQLLQRLQGHKGHVKAVVFDPQAQWLASAGYDKRIIRWSLATGQQIQPEWQTPDKVWTLAVSPDGNYLASGGKDNNITLWDVNTGLKRIFTGHEDDIKGLAFSSNGKLASASYDGTIRLWDVASGEKLHKLIGHTDKVYSVAFSPDDKWLASGSKDTTVRLWEVDSGNLKHSLFGHKKGVFGLSFSAEGHYVVSASDDLTLRIWDTQSGVTMRVLQEHTAGVNGVVISPAGKIFSVSDDATVRRWNMTLPYQQAIDFVKTPLAAAIAPDANSVAVGFKDGTLRLYALPKTKLLWEQQTAHAKGLRRIAFNQDGSLLASASADRTAKLWQAKEGKLIQTLTGHKEVVNAVAFAPNDNILVTASFSGQVGLFTIGTKQKNFYEPHDSKDVNAITFDVSGTKLLSTGDEDVRLWDINNETPRLLEKYSKATGLILWSALSPDGKQIASVGRDQLVHIYSAKDKPITYDLKGHENTIYRVIFSPTGQQIATVSSDATLRVWDLHNGMELFSLRLPTNSGKPVPLKDFDFQCSPKEGDCWIAVPLARGKLMLYKLKNIYDTAQ
jgi:WD40 repeat protein